MFSTYGSHHVVSVAPRCFRAGTPWRRRSSSILRSSFAPCQSSYLTSRRCEFKMPKREPMKPHAHHPKPISSKRRRLDSKNRSESAWDVWLAQPNSPTTHHTPFFNGSSHRFNPSLKITFMPTSAKRGGTRFSASTVAASCDPPGWPSCAVARERDPPFTGNASAAPHPANLRLHATFLSVPHFPSMSSAASAPPSPIATSFRIRAQSPFTT